MLETLLARLIDDAAQFPPARLRLAAAVKQHRAHRAGAHAWMLGRFLCPASRLDELAAAGDVGSPVGVVSDVGWREDLEAAVAAGADCLEVRAPADLAALGEAPLAVFVEGVDPSELAGSDVGAKLRCGGLTADAFPSDEAVAAFIRACREHDVAFKCTAGLHHPFRTRDEEIGVLQHGFLNLLTATVVDDVEAAVAAPAEEFDLSPAGLRWRGLSVDAEAARRLYTAHGSCSFDEPVADLRPVLEAAHA
jgi:hypothetical protein